MTNFNEITYEEINRLNQDGFTKLLQMLLYSEAFSNGLFAREVEVPLNITVGDGGEDGRIIWSEGPRSTNWLPSRINYFQVKATEMSPAKSKTEVQKVIKVKNKETKILKPQVEECFESEGTYILFVRQALNPSKKKTRIKKIREGIKECGKKYFDTCSIEIYDSNKIASWANTNPAAVVFVKSSISKPSAISFKTFRQWKTYGGEEFDYRYQENERLSKWIADIKQVFVNEGKVLRVTGLSGLGKSRLIFEAIARDTGADIESRMLQSAVLYYDFSSRSDALIDHVANLCLEKNAKCNLIIDNCPLELHNRLRRELTGTRFNLVTIFHEPEEESDLAEYSKILLKPDDFMDVVPKILEHLFPRIPSESRKRIEDFALGFPLIAVLLAKQLNKGSNSIGELTEDEISNKLLGLDGKNEDTRKILTSVALFDHIGFFEDKVAQRNALATNDLIVGLSGSEKSVEAKFFRVCSTYLDRGILEKKGRMIFLKPRPLALRLARDWWNGFPSDKIQELLDDVEKLGLSTQLCDQISRLDYVPKTKSLTEDLCGSSGFFGKAEVLNSEKGSRLFRSLVEVNPEATVNCLVRVYGSMSVEELNNVSDGRRNLVWSLEKLAFRSDTFSKAVRILTLFSIAENETWSNNATGQLLHLFQPYLAGTEANLVQRIEALESIRQKDEKLFFSAMKSGLRTHSFMRTVGAERQGSSTGLIDYHPKGSEVIKYWEGILELLRQVVMERGDNYEEAKQILAESIFQLSIANSVKLVLPLIKEIVENEGGSWLLALNNCKRVLNNPNSLISSEERLELERLVENLEPTDLESRYKKIVANPNRDDFQRDAGSLHERMIQRTREFSKEFSDEVADFSDFMELIYTGDQFQGIWFGEEMGGLLAGNKRKSFLNQTIEYFTSKSGQNFNPIVLVGFLAKGKPEEVEQVLSEFEQFKHLDKVSFSIVSRLKGYFKQILGLFQLIDRNPELSIVEFNAFQYGAALNSLDPEEVHLLCDRLAEYGVLGVWIALALLESYCYNNENRWEGLKTLAVKLLEQKGVLKINPENIRLDGYGWESLVNKILSEENQHEFAVQMAEQIVEFCNTSEFNYGLDVPVKNILISIIQKYFDVTWPILGKALLSQGEEYMIYFHFQHLIGSSFSYDEGIIFKYGNHDTIYSWVVKNGHFAAERIAQIMPTLMDDAKSGWHPFALKIINEFGHHMDVLRNIGSNLHTFSWSGSVVPLYQSTVKALEYLADHEVDNVRLWSQGQLEWYKKAIKEESNFDEERFL